MSQDDTAAGRSEPTTTDEIRAEIEETRAELADTVDRLSEKLDVKAQAGRKVTEVKQAAMERRQPLLIGVSIAGSMVVLLVVRRVRRRKRS